MARFVSLKFRTRWCGLAVGGLGMLACFSTAARGSSSSAPAQAPAASGKTSAAPTPTPPPDTFNRYGKIWSPSDDANHPIKLNVQFPSVADIKIPSQDELNVRDKLEQLATLSDADIHKQLEQWPPYAKMNLRDQGTMLQRIQDFRDYRTRVALQKAHDLGLLGAMTPDQKIHFEKDYWGKRLQMDRDLTKQFEPVFQAREQKLEDELFREFSPVNPEPVAQNSKPPQPPAPDPKAKSAPAPSASATNKTSPIGPVAQTPSR